MAQEALEQFHATHPNIRVFFVPDPVDVTEAMLAEMEAGTAPDVFQGCCTHFPAWAQTGHTLDLRSYVEADLDQTTIDEWDPAQYRALFASDGQQFGLPKYHGALALYYNKDLFDEYGIVYPDGTWDHDDYMAAMKGLTHDRERRWTDGPVGQHAGCHLGPHPNARQWLGRSPGGPDRSQKEPSFASQKQWRRRNGSELACGTIA